MAVKRPTRTLDEHERARVFTQLAALLNAGMPLDRAITTLEGDHPAVAASLAAALKRIQKGSSFAAAAKAARLTSALDDALVLAAETAGRLGPALARLGVWYDSRVARARKVRSGLIFPALVLTLAAFVQPLPALIGGDLTLGMYVLAAGRTLLVFAALFGLVAWIYARLQQRNTRKDNAIDRLRLALPLLGPHHQRGQILSLLSAFEMLYTAGLPPDRAMSVATRVCNNGCIRASFANAHAALAAGNSITEVLSASPYVSARAREFIKAGDAAGDLSASLQRFEHIEGEEIAQTDQAFADWIPKIVYALVAGWMVSTLI